MPKQWVIPDIHGYIKTLRALVEDLIRPGRYDELYFLGDYIDRGPASMEVIDYIRSLQKDQYTITALRGNHEQSFLDLYEKEKKGRNFFFNKAFNRKRMAWFSFGGRSTLKSFQVKNIRDIPQEYADWMNELGYFVMLDRFILVHAGLNFQIDDPFQDTHAMLWVRDFDINPEKTGNRRIIHGHVPVNIELINLSIHNSYYKFIDLDNGPYMTGKDGFGNLCALELTSMEIVIQNNLDL
ncbi:MAG: metallophosphoesterase family protein [Bacteroidetes bacterium]|nr:metallophosphoesterase family protein [Bacteroidota bacterium]